MTKLEYMDLRILVLEEEILLLQTAFIDWLPSSDASLLTCKRIELEALKAARKLITPVESSG